MNHEAEQQINNTGHFLFFDSRTLSYNLCDFLDPAVGLHNIGIFSSHSVIRYSRHFAIIVIHNPGTFEQQCSTWK